MTRSKTRLLDHSADGRWLRTRIEREDGQVVQGHYKLVVWQSAPQDVLDKVEAAVKSGHVQTLDL